MTKLYCCADLEVAKKYFGANNVRYWSPFDGDLDCMVRHMGSAEAVEHMINMIDESADSLLKSTNMGGAALLVPLLTERLVRVFDNDFVVIKAEGEGDV